MKYRTLLLHGAITIFVVAMFSGCISSDDGAKTYEGEIEDLLITSDLLPEGWYLDDTIDYCNIDCGHLNEEQIKEGYQEAIGARFRITVMSDGWMTSDYLQQTVSRYDIEDTGSLVDKRMADIVSAIEELIDADQQNSGFQDIIVEYLGTPTVGDHSLVLKATYVPHDGETFSNYYVMSSKDDIVISFTYMPSTEGEYIDVNYLLNLAKNLTQHM